MMIAGWALLIPFNPPAAATVLVCFWRGVFRVFSSFLMTLLEELGVEMPALAAPAVGAFLARTAWPLLSNFFSQVISFLLPRIISSLLPSFLTEFGFDFLQVFFDLTAFSGIRRLLSLAGFPVDHFEPVSLQPFRTRKPIFRIINCVKRYIIADSGATNTLAHALLPGDYVTHESPVKLAGGSKGWCEMTAYGECIMKLAKNSVAAFDQLLCIGRAVASGATFHWAPDSKPTFSHPNFDAPIVCEVVDFSPTLSESDFVKLRQLSAQAPVFRRMQASWFDDAAPSMSQVLLGICDSRFDACADQGWFSKAFLLQFRSDVLRTHWRTADGPDAFLTSLLSPDLNIESYLRGGEVSTPVDDDYFPQVRFQQVAPEVAVEDTLFTVLGKSDLAGLSDELKCSDDIANARHKGPMSYDAQEKITSLLKRGGKPIVSADLCFPSQASLGMTAIWVFEILMLSPTDEQLQRLVFPCPVRSESFDDLKPWLLMIRRRFTAMEQGFDFRTEQEKASKNAEFKSWCASQLIATETTQSFRHPSFEVAVGQTERNLRKLFFLQHAPGISLWAAGTLYLQYRAMREAAPEFGVKISFRFDFPLSLCYRMAWGPLPGKKNPVTHECGFPLVVLFPRWQSSNTVVCLSNSQSHQGLKISEHTYQELKFTKMLCFSRDVNSTLSIRHFLKQPFTRAVVKKTVPPKHTNCPACVRESLPRAGRGRPPVHKCDDGCGFSETHIFRDDELILDRGRVPEADARMELFVSLAVLQAETQDDTDDEFCPAIHQFSVGEQPVAEPALRQAAVFELNRVERAFSDEPSLKRICSMGPVPPDVAGCLLQHMQDSLRREVDSAAELCTEPAAMNFEQQLGGNPSVVRTHHFVVDRSDDSSTSELYEPGFYALVLNVREQIQLSKADSELRERIVASGDRELGNMLYNPATKRATLELAKISEVKKEDIIIPSLVVLSEKRDKRMKSRLVGCGNFDPTVDASSAYSSTVDQSFFRMFIVLAVLLGWSIGTLDICEAFCQADEKDKNSKSQTYIRLPSAWRSGIMPTILSKAGIDSSNYNSHCLRVLGWLYGERQAPSKWRATMLRYILSLAIQYENVSLHFKQSEYDPDILYIYHVSCTILVLLYVDDVWVICQRSCDLKYMLQQIESKFKCTPAEILCGLPRQLEDGTTRNRHFAVTTLEDAPCFCGVALYFQLVNSIVYLVLDQTEYTTALLAKLVEKGCVSQEQLSQRIDTLKSDSFSICFLSEAVESNPLMSKLELTHLRVIVNSISYLALRTRPELLTPLGSLARGQSVKGRKRFLDSAIILAAYLHTHQNRTLNLAVFDNVSDIDKFTPPRAKDLSSVTIFNVIPFDSNLPSGESTKYHDSEPDCYPRYGFVQQIGISASRLCSWMHKSILAKVISVSTLESELGAASAAAKEAVASANVLRETLAAVRLPPSQLMGDCFACNQVSNNAANLRRVRHLSLSHLLVRQLTREGRCHIDKVASEDNISDLLTKILHEDQILHLLQSFGVFVL